MKAAEYGLHTPTVTALVSTNSICQGQQVPTLWPSIFSTGNHIAFAHTSFKWANLASQNAGVTVVIVGISNKPHVVRQIFSLTAEGETIAKGADNINAYLIAGKNTEVVSISKPTDERATMQFGNHTYYGVDLLVSRDEVRRIEAEWPDSKALFRDF
jgi:hypothetical protein